MRTVTFMVCILLISSALMLQSVYAQEDMMQIDNTVFQKPVRPRAVFPHEAHNEKAAIEECNTCHHVYDEGKLVEDESSEDQRCSECHLPEKKGNAPSLMKAFHRNCKSCHLARKAGPIMCGECHKRSDR